MPQRLQTSRRGLELIKSFEGFRACSVKVRSGYLIGYGHTKTAESSQKITRPQAEHFLRTVDLPPIEQAINDIILSPLSQNEFDALVSFAFNIGLDAFRGSEVVRYLNEGNHLASAHAMTFWRKGRIEGRLTIVDALVRRRAAEHALFLEPVNGQVGLTSAMVRAEKDFDDRRRVLDIPDVVIEPRIKPGSDDTAPLEKPGGKLGVREEAEEAIRRGLQEILGLQEEDIAIERTDVEITKAGTGLNDQYEEIGEQVRHLADRLEAKGLGTGQSNEIASLPELEDFDEGGGASELEYELPPLDDVPLVVDGSGRAIVDDLEVVDVDHDLLVTAQTQRSNEAWFSDLPSVLKYSGMAGLGVGGLIFGSQHFYKPSGVMDVVTLGPLVILASLIVLLIAIYWLLREFNQTD